MKERPILFSAPMVRAILEGRKTQTRRILKTQPFNVVPFIGADDRPTGEFGLCSCHHMVIDQHVRCPYGQPGDRLWVREAHAIVPRTAYAQSEGVQQTIRRDDNHDAAIYREGWDRSEGGIRWRPSIHMPRWASRITLEITGVRVERLQDISEEDALAEGVRTIEDAAKDGATWCDKPRRAFRFLWQSINGPASWDENPWVWVVELKRVEQLEKVA